MNDRKYAVLLTDVQEIKIIECNPDKEIFDIARSAIGCEWIEVVRPLPHNFGTDWVMLIDEEGKLLDNTPSINCTASYLYGSNIHKDPIVGSVVIAKNDGENLTLLTGYEAELLAAVFQQNICEYITVIAKSFNVHITYGMKEGKEDEDCSV